MLMTIPRLSEVGEFEAQTCNRPQMLTKYTKVWFTAACPASCGSTPPDAVLRLELVFLSMIWIVQFVKFGFHGRIAVRQLFNC